MDHYLETEHLTVTHPHHHLPLLRAATLRLQPGSMHAIIGESGSGKTLLAHALMRCLPAPLQQTGTIKVSGHQWSEFSTQELESARGCLLSMMLQDSSGAFNPLLPLGMQIQEAARAHVPDDRLSTLLQACGLPQDDAFLQKYPHQISGGQRQRCQLAASCINFPHWLIVDEPTTALDPLSKKQVLALLHKLCTTMHMGIVLITHDLEALSHYCASITVLYDGVVVEHNTSFKEHLFHPYTTSLYRCRLPKKKSVQPFYSIPRAQAPSHSGCPFQARCERAQPQCTQFPPVTSHTAGSYRCFNPHTS